MNEYTAYCGLDCEACQARLATVNNDDALRQRVAREWSELNGVEISAEMINCSGCRVPGVKTPYCDSLCPIRQCAMGKQMETCGECPEMNSCEKLSMITGNNAKAFDDHRKQCGCTSQAERARIIAIWILAELNTLGWFFAGRK